MEPTNERSILVVGATGLQGAAVCRELVQAGWVVAGLTRDRSSTNAVALAKQDVELVEGNLDSQDDVARAVAGHYGVFVALDPMTHGADKEIEQGVRVIDQAKAAGVSHLVYSSVASAEAPSGVSHFASKLHNERHLAGVGLNATILRPTSFMEDLTEKKFVPPVLWHVWTAVSGADTKLKFVAVDDIARATAAAFGDPAQWVGKTIPMVGDILSLAECRALFKRVDGRAPLRIPMPVFLFRKLVSEDLHRLFSWYRKAGFEGSVDATRAIVPNPLTMQEWLEEKRRRSPQS